MATTFLEAGSDATQDLSFYPFTGAGAGGSVASATDQQYTGPRSIKTVCATANTSSFFTTRNAVVSDAGGAVSFRYRTNSASPSAKTGVVCIEQVNDGVSILGICLNTDGTLGLSANTAAGSTSVSGTTVLSANTWYRLTLTWVITSTSNWTAKLYINGSLEKTMTNADATLQFVTSSCVSFGILAYDYVSNTSGTFTSWFDDIYMNDNSGHLDPGDVRVTNKRPNANGTLNEFTTQIGSGGSGYGSGHSPQVNEQPLSTTNGWSFTVAGVAKTEEYSVEGVATGDVDFTSYTLVDYEAWVYAASSSSVTCNLVVGGSTSAFTLGTTNAIYAAVKGSTSYPGGSTDVGLTTSTSASTVSLYECGIHVAGYVAAATSRPMFRGS